MVVGVGCDIEPRTPLIDFVPRRLLNFFVGSEDCASQGRRQFSRLERGVLTIDCDPEGACKCDLQLLHAARARVCVCHWMSCSR
jgi:hypothetical protein